MLSSSGIVQEWLDIGCQKHHQSPLDRICVHSLCSRHELVCQECVKEFHGDHLTMELQEFKDRFNELRSRNKIGQAHDPFANCFSILQGLGKDIGGITHGQQMQHQRLSSVMLQKLKLDTRQHLDDLVERARLYQFVTDFVYSPLQTRDIRQINQMVKKSVQYYLLHKDCPMEERLLKMCEQAKQKVNTVRTDIENGSMRVVRSSTNLTIQNTRQYLGMGSSGQVYKASSSEGNVFAVKISKFFNEKEAKLHFALQHENILKMLEAFRCSDRTNEYAIVLEKGDRTLDKIFQRMDDSGIHKAMLGLARGLEYLHRHGIAHLDLKLENILVKDGVVKIADFGSARRFNVIEEITEQGQIYKVFEKFREAAGTKDYRAPEMWGSQPQFEGPKADVYALGWIYLQLALKQTSSIAIRRLQGQYKNYLPCQLGKEQIKVLVELLGKQQRLLKVLIRKMLRRRPQPRCDLTFVFTNLKDIL